MKPAESSRRSFLQAAGATALFAWRRPTPPSAPGQITAVTLIHGIPGREEDLQAHLLSLTGPTRLEPGCLQYDLYQSPDQPHEFMRLEVWTSEAALEAHKQMPHLRASFQKRQREGWTTRIMVFQRVPD